jgi:hypothetical protein
MGVDAHFSGNGKKKSRGRSKTTITTPRDHYDWVMIEQFFVQDESLPTYVAIKKKFKISIPTIMKHANRDEWEKKREEYWTKVQNDVFKRVQTYTVANRVNRFKKVSSTINRMIAALSKQGKINESTVQDLARMMDIEASLLRGAISSEGASDEVMTEIVEAQILRIRKISGERRDNLDALLNAGLQRLGLVEGEEAGDGSGPQREGVRVRPALPQEREG